MKLATIAFALVLFTPGCVSQALKDQVEVSTAAADGHDRLVRAAGLTKADLDATPPKVRELLVNAVRALYAHRYGWHRANFAANDGPDPASLDLETPELYR